VTQRTFRRDGLEPPALSSSPEEESAMDVPLKVYVTCPMAELKQVPGTLIAVSPHGFYEVNVAFGANTHLMVVPINATTLTAQEPVLNPPASFEVER
jgi:hypothetical protein